MAVRQYEAQDQSGIAYRFLNDEKTLVDVFTGNGWKNHSRFERTEDKGVRLIKGEPVSNEQYQEVRNVLLSVRKKIG